MNPDHYEAPVAPPTDLDAMLTPDEAAKWLKMSVRKLRENVNDGRIPCMRINRKNVRFHPRSVIAALQKKGKS